MLKKVLLLIYFLSSAFLHGAAAGKRTSVTKASWQQVMARLVKEMDKYDKNQLYHTLTQAEREKGAKKIFNFLLDSSCQQMETLPASAKKFDFFGLAIVCINLGLIRQGITLKAEDDFEAAKALFAEIEEIQAALFSFLQQAANDGNCSPRGSSDIIKRKKDEQKKSPSPLTKELIIEE